MSFKHSVICFTVGLLLNLPAAAQFKAAIQGTITDPSSATVPAAKVTLTDPQTGTQRSTESSAEGVYRFDGLGPGRYTILVEATGFESQTIENVNVLAEQTQGVNISLTPGQIRESITVSGATAPAIQTENAEVAGTLTNLQVQNLPQIGRDPYELLRLAPGVFGAGRATAAAIRYAAQYDWTGRLEYAPFSKLKIRCRSPRTASGFPRTTS